MQSIPDLSIPDLSITNLSVIESLGQNPPNPPTSQNLALSTALEALLAPSRFPARPSGASALSLELLATLTRGDVAYCRAFGLTATNLETWVTAQARWIQTWGTAFAEVWAETCHRDPMRDRGWLVNLWRLWLPLAEQLQRKQQQKQAPWVQGILGVQGTGKTTLGILLSWILERQGLGVVSLSLDDLYKTHADRQALQAQEPRLRWRGPPGTHDVALGIQVLDQLRSTPRPSSLTSATLNPESIPESSRPDSQILTSPKPQPIELPRFDKSLWHGSGDRIAPEPVWGADIILFEGWCVGMRPLPGEALAPLCAWQFSDADYGFAAWCNDRLQDYLPLWDRLDALLILAPQDYRWSLTWREEAEAQLRHTGQGAMSSDAVAEFVRYFWTALHPQLFLPPLLTDPTTNLVVEVAFDRSLGRIYRPKGSMV